MRACLQFCQTYAFVALILLCGGCAGEGAYCLTHGAVGNHVALVASEPITGSSAEWVSVPAGTALVISRERNGYINIMHSPLDASKGQSRLDEVARSDILLLLTTS